MIFSADFTALHVEFFFALGEDSTEGAWGAVGDAGTEAERSVSLERPREKRDLKVRDAAMGNEVAACLERAAGELRILKVEAGWGDVGGGVEGVGRVPWS